MSEMMNIRDKLEKNREIAPDRFKSFALTAVLAHEINTLTNLLSTSFGY